MIVVVLGVITFVFLLLHLAPGDPVDFLVVSPYATKGDIQAMREVYGLDKSLVGQYWAMITNSLKGDFGKSFFHGRPVFDLVLERLPATLELSILAILTTAVIAIPIGLVSALRRGSWADHMSSLLMFVGIATPNFWLGLVLILIFSTFLGLLPTFGRGPSLVSGFMALFQDGPRSLLQSVSYLVLPTASLAVYYASIIGQLARGSIIEEFRKDYLRTLRAKGVREGALIFRHLLKNISVPIINVLGLQLAALIGGAVVIETVFSWPGVGLLLIQAIVKRDYPVVQAIVILVSVSYVVINVIVDLIHMYVDPRVRA
jgi:peptide/nickel transport system permease protein